MICFRPYPINLNHTRNNYTHIYKGDAPTIQQADDNTKTKPQPQKPNNLIEQLKDKDFKYQEKPQKQIK